MRYLTTGLAGLALLTVLASQAVPQEDGKKRPEDMMAVMMKYATPGKHHKAMEYFLGEWDVDVTIMMPGAGPMKSKGAAKFEWLFPNRWMSQRISYPFMGMAYEAFAIHGFDNYKQKFVTTIVSTMDTAMLRSEGTVVDPAGKEFAEYGVLDEPMMNQHDKPYRVITRRETDNTFSLEIWDLGIGAQGHVVIRYNYTRKQ